MGIFSKQPLHGETWFLVMVVGMVFASLNLRGAGFMPPEDVDAVSSQGWPVVFAEYISWEPDRSFWEGGDETPLMKPLRRWQIMSFDPVGALVDFSFLLVLGFSVGFVVERWMREREAGIQGGAQVLKQFTLKSLLSVTLVVGVMFGVLKTTPNLLATPLDVFVWLSSGFIGFGVLCVLITIVDVGRWVSGRTKTEAE